MAVKKIVAVAIGPRRDSPIGAAGAAVNVRPYVAGLIKGLTERGHHLGPDYEIDYKERPHSELSNGHGSDVFGGDGHAAYDIIFAMSTNVVRAAKEAGHATPIVGVVSDHRAEGFSRTRTITGISARRSHTAGQCFEYFLATVPTLKKVRVLHKPKYGPSERSLKLVKAAAKKRGVAVEVLSVQTREDIEKKLKAMAKRDLKKPAEAGVLVLPVDVALGAAQLIIDLAQGQKNVPAFFPVTDFVKNGALGGYGVPQHTCGLLMADYVARILWQSAQPQSLKVTEAGSGDFEWAVSRAAADALNVRLPHII
jgi:ABC-type uncharacterized transport system substrate-binding protein